MGSYLEGFAVVNPVLFSWQFYSFDAIANFSIVEVKGFLRYVAQSKAFDFSGVSPVMQRQVFTSFCKGSLVIHLGFAVFQLSGFGNFAALNFFSFSSGSHSPAIAKVIW